MCQNEYHCFTHACVRAWVNSHLWWPLCPADSASSPSWQSSVCCLCSKLCSPGRFLKTRADLLNKGYLKCCKKQTGGFIAWVAGDTFFSNSPVSSLSSRKNFWLKMKATPLISSTLASAVVFLLTKLAVMAMANFPRNSLRPKPAERGRKTLAMDHVEGMVKNV